MDDTEKARAREARRAEIEAQRQSLARRRSALEAEREETAAAIETADNSDVVFELFQEEQEIAWETRLLDYEERRSAAAELTDDAGRSPTTRSSEPERSAVAAIRSAYRESSDADAFVAALKDQGFVVARADGPSVDIVAVGRDNAAYGLLDCLDVFPFALVHHRMATIGMDELPMVQEVVASRARADGVVPRAPDHADGRDAEAAPADQSAETLTSNGELEAVRAIRTYIAAERRHRDPQDRAMNPDQIPGEELANRAGWARECMLDTLAALPDERVRVVLDTYRKPGDGNRSVPVAEMAEIQENRLEIVAFERGLPADASEKLVRAVMRRAEGYARYFGAVVGKELEANAAKEGTVPTDEVKKNRAFHREASVRWQQAKERLLSMGYVERDGDYVKVSPPPDRQADSNAGESRPKTAPSDAREPPVEELGRHRATVLEPHPAEQPDIARDIGGFLERKALRPKGFVVSVYHIDPNGVDRELIEDGDRSFPTLEAAVAAFQKAGVGQMSSAQLVAEMGSARVDVAWKGGDGHIDGQSDSYVSEGENWLWRSAEGEKRQRGVPTGFQAEQNRRQRSDRPFDRREDMPSPEQRLVSRGEGERDGESVQRLPRLPEHPNRAALRGMNAPLPQVSLAPAAAPVVRQQETGRPEPAQARPTAPAKRGGLMVAAGAGRGVMSLLDFVGSFLSGGSRQPVDPSDQITRQRRAQRALKSIAESIAAGEGLRAVDLEHLTPSHLENIRLRGDDAVRQLCEGIQRRRTREIYGREF